MKARRAFIAAVLLCAGFAPAHAAQVVAEGPPGAASCTGCHAAKPNVDMPVPRLAGQDAAALATALRDFRGGQRSATVMDRIAKGFSDDEIKAIAAWFSAQP
jgi:sulfide dehydrogenase cytochrome subunit